MLKNTLSLPGAATTAKTIVVLHDVKIDKRSSPFAVSSMATTGRGACSVVHPIGDPRLTVAKQQTTLNARSGQHDEEGSTQFTPRLWRGGFEARVGIELGPQCWIPGIPSRASGSIL
jgi:hypothetical protein